MSGSHISLYSVPCTLRTQRKPDSLETPRSHPTNLKRGRWDCRFLLPVKAYDKSLSTTLTCPQAVPSQLLLPFNRADISNICYFSTSSTCFLLNLSELYCCLHHRENKDVISEANVLIFHHTHLPGSRLLLPFLYNPKPSFTLNSGLHSVHLPRDSEGWSPSLQLLPFYSLIPILI